jgi:hypothetical protein
MRNVSGSYRESNRDSSIVQPIAYSTLKRMASSGMLRRVTLVRTNVSEELIASIIRVARIGELGTTLRRLLVTANVPSSPIFSP